MAANIPPQMVPNHMMLLQQQQQQQQRVKSQQQQQQINQLVMTYVVNTQPEAAPNTWQSAMSHNERYGKTLNLVTNVILAMSTGNFTAVFQHATDFEKKAWLSSENKAMYDRALQGKIDEMVARRQGNTQQLQNQLQQQQQQQQQHHQQQQQRQQQHQQQQMLMNQMAAARMGPTGQPGFPGMQNPMQVPQGPPQAQLGMGLAGNPQNRPGQPPFGMQMGQPARPMGPMGQLQPNEINAVNEVAQRLMSQVPEPQKAQMRQKIMENLGPRAAQFHGDVLVWHFQQEALRQMTASRQRQAQALGQQRMANGMPQGQPGQMNPNQLMINPLAQQPVMPNGPMLGANIETIRNERQQALLAQQQGQMVVPASNGQARTVTPGPMNGMPGAQPSVNQASRPMPAGQNFGVQQPGVARGPMMGHPMQGQPGGLAGPPTTSQSPAMNTLNAPMQQPPVPMGHVGRQPPVNPGNPAMGSLNPQFSHQNNTRPPSAMPGVMNGAALAGGRGIPEGAMGNWNQQQRAAMMSGLSMGTPGQMPGAPEQLRAGQMNMANQGPGPNGPPNPAVQAKMLEYLQTPHGKAAIDNMDIAPGVFGMLANNGTNVGPNIKKWFQLKALAVNNPAQLNMLQAVQHRQFAVMWNQQQKRQQANQPQGNPGAPFQPPQLPPGEEYPQHVAQLTPQEVQAFMSRSANHANQNPAMVSEILRRLKYTDYAKKIWEKHNKQQQQQQQGINNVNAGGQKAPSQIVPPTPTTQPGAPPMAQPNMPPKPSSTPVAPPASTPARQTPKIPQQPQPQQQSQPAPQSQQQPGQHGPNPSPVPAPRHNLKRKPDDSEGAAQANNAAQRPAPGPGAQTNIRAPPPFKPLPEEQVVALGPQERAEYDATLRLHQRITAITTEEQLFAQGQNEVPVPMDAELLGKTRRTLLGALSTMRGVSAWSQAWFFKTKDEERLRIFLRARHKLYRQLVPNKDASQPSTILRPVLTISPQELDQIQQMLKNMATDIKTYCVPSLGLQNSWSQANGGTPTQRPAQAPTPLSQANLEKQTQALKQAQNRTAAKNVAAPAAPTTTQPPFSFGAHKSPAGNPEYLSEPLLTRDGLQAPPARKKPKTGANHSSPPAIQPGTGSLSPNVKAPSPVVSRKQEPAKTAPKFMCPEPGCEQMSVGFESEEALGMHKQEEHIRPFQDPVAFMRENMAAALKLDEQGRPVSAPAMVGSLSKQGQTPMSKPDLAATPMSRDASMRRQGSAAGGRESTATPRMAASTPMAPMDEMWAGTTIDPQNLFAGLGPTIDATTGNMMHEFGTYRSITPNDTPESTASKDSGVSEPNSDILEGTGLDINLTFQNFNEDVLMDMNRINMDSLDSLVDSDLYGPGGGFGGGQEAYQFTFEDMTMGNDFSKPFQFDNSGYMMDASV
ncbi:uncharacterized protein QC763_710460 [Podospora pseudopauciseta]|uniref:Mediator complex subunit 15 KIX domain-containing protein n=1 Tax=Podospora pseudopauciseta TaxID=2093780 RepID=A0ABR0H2D2_9PEZI|nr:hypothetical protein QC763_710460 [Podospora pseudopauciseta]